MHWTVLAGSSWDLEVQPYLGPYISIFIASKSIFWNNWDDCWSGSHRWFTHSPMARLLVFQELVRLLLWASPSSLIYWHQPLSNLAFKVQIKSLLLGFDCASSKCGSRDSLRCLLGSFQCPCDECGRLLQTVLTFQAWLSTDQKPNFYFSDSFASNVTWDQS